MFDNIALLTRSTQRCKGVTTFDAVMVYGAGGQPSASGQPGARGVAVDGVPEATVDAWFAEADQDGDGRICGVEAKDFFLRTNLPKQALSKVRVAGWEAQLM